MRLIPLHCSAHANLQQPWLRGCGCNQETWKLGRFPTAAELDGAIADRPMWLERVDGHAGWANSRALTLAGITNTAPDPAGGRITRDAAGNATGILVDAAQDLTSVHDAGIEVGNDRLYRDYADRGKLTTRVYAMIGGAASRPPGLPEEVNRSG